MVLGVAVGAVVAPRRRTGRIARRAADLVAVDVDVGAVRALDRRWCRGDVRSNGRWRWGRRRGGAGGARRRAGRRGGRHHERGETDRLVMRVVLPAVLLELTERGGV